MGSFGGETENNNKKKREKEKKDSNAVAGASLHAVLDSLSKKYNSLTMLPTFLVPSGAWKTQLRRF